MSTVQRRRRRGPFSLLASPIGRKLLTGVTGIVWALYALLHMVGNLGYFSSDPDAYNLYADFLLGLGPLLYLAEAILLVTILLHAYVGVGIWWRKRQARKHGYAAYEVAGAPSLQTFSSRTMALTGVILGIFLVVHVATFKYGVGLEDYTTTVQGETVTVQGQDVDLGGKEVRDLKRTVTEAFQNPLWAFSYVIVMILLAFHLRHGIWSAFQSLGLMNARSTRPFYTFGTILAILIAVGFILIPLWIYFAV